MPVVDAQRARAVADDVGGARHDDDAAVGARQGADEPGALAHVERGRGVDALLGDGRAVEGLDLALVALDDGEVAGREERLDGLAADGRCTGSGKGGGGVSRRKR